MITRRKKLHTVLAFVLMFAVLIGCIPASAAQKDDVQPAGTIDDITAIAAELGIEIPDDIEAILAEAAVEDATALEMLEALQDPGNYRGGPLAVGQEALPSLNNDAVYPYSVYAGYVMEVSETGTVTVLAGGAVQEIPVAEDISIDRFATGNKITPTGNLVEFTLNEAGEIDQFRQVMTLPSGAGIFDTMKYGPQLSDHRLVASGWLVNTYYPEGYYNPNDDSLSAEQLAKNGLAESLADNEISVSDYALFSEKYTLADDVVVYLISKSAPQESRVADLETLRSYEQYVDQTAPVRYQAYVIFDQDYLSADEAQVTEVYLFNEPLAQARTTGAFLVAQPDDAPQPGGVTNDMYIRATEPFEMVEGVMYYIGDNEVCSYLFNTDEGLIVLDTGWPNSGYQYMANIEKMGYDPREVSIIYSTHAHGDHYGTAGEFMEMIEAAGGTIQFYSCREDAEGYEGWDNIPGIYTGTNKYDILFYEAIASENGNYYTWDEWMDYGNVRFLPVLTAGHTIGAGSFAFEVTKANGEVLTFGYQGGYGTNGLVESETLIKNGNDQTFLRLAFQYGLAYLQQNIDADYVSPQHTNQYPILEVYQTAKKAGVSFIDALNKGTEFEHYCEKRYQVILWGAVNNSRNMGVRPGHIAQFGPYKTGRENGRVDVQAVLYEGKVIQGFNKYQNQNGYPGFEEGFVVFRDSDVHDPEGWYVQFNMDVLDEYDGTLPTGPIEAVRDTRGDGSIIEVLRTTRLDSREEAEAILNSVEYGEAYYLALDNISQIQVAANSEDTFRKIESVREEKVTVDGASLKTIGKGDTLQLSATVSPADATYDVVRWESSTPAIATVDKNGVVTAIKSGSVRITATSVNGKTAAVVVRVTA